MPKHPTAPHHSAPCQHPTASGLPCPYRAVDHHPEHGAICALHAHHNQASLGRTASINVRLHPNEYKAVSVVADTLQVSLSDLGRDMLLGLPLPHPPPPKIDVQTYGQLGKIGTNLNQIARALNALLAGGDGTADSEVRDLHLELAELRETLKQVRLGLVGEP